MSELSALDPQVQHSLDEKLCGVENPVHSATCCSAFEKYSIEMQTLLQLCSTVYVPSTMHLW